MKEKVMLIKEGYGWIWRLVQDVLAIQVAWVQFSFVQLAQVVPVACDVGPLFILEILEHTHNILNLAKNNTYGS